MENPSDYSYCINKRRSVTYVITCYHLFFKRYIWGIGIIFSDEKVKSSGNGIYFLSGFTIMSVRVYSNTAIEVNCLLTTMKQTVQKNYEQLKHFRAYRLSLDDYYEYTRTGNRLDFENKYFAKRSCLTARAMHAYFVGKKANHDLLKIIHSICDEPSWVLPAHMEHNPFIDLFSAMTAQMLCEIAHYIKLPDEIHQKIHDTVKIRIKDNYENHVLEWESYENNWLPVCAGRIGMVYLYEFPEDFPKVKKRILGSMQKYIEAFGEDGACTEGVGYWRFGFGNYIFFAEMLKRVEGTDILKDAKIKEIAKFQQYMFLKNNITASFSDTTRQTISYSPGMTYFLRKSFGSEIKMPPKEYMEIPDNSYDWTSVFRAFLWFDPDILSDDPYFAADTEEKYFGDAKWYLNRKKAFSFAAKAGHNQEFHNHNDIGSFIITDGTAQLISDFGAGEYTKDYFTQEKRYENFCCSSMSHSVPIIDGGYQAVGKQHRSHVLQAEGNRFCLEMHEAYDVEGLREFRREFRIGESGVSLCDRFEFTDGEHEIAERFLSMVRPEQEGESLKIGGMKIQTNHAAQITEKSLNNHHGEQVTVYMIDFSLRDGEFDIEFLFE